MLELKLKLTEWKLTEPTWGAQHQPLWYYYFFYFIFLHISLLELLFIRRIGAHLLLRSRNEEKKNHDEMFISHSKIVDIWTFSLTIIINNIFVSSGDSVTYGTCIQTCQLFQWNMHTLFTGHSCAIQCLWWLYIMFLTNFVADNKQEILSNSIKNLESGMFPSHLNDWMMWLWDYFLDGFRVLSSSNFNYFTAFMSNHDLKIQPFIFSPPFFFFVHSFYINWIELLADYWLGTFTNYVLH